MSLIQRIRDKGAVLIVVLIVIALIGFILMDALVGRTGGGLFAQSNTVAGKINGVKVNADELDNLGFYSEMLSMQNQRDEEALINARNQGWETRVTIEALNKEADKMGIIVSEDEVKEALRMGQNNWPSAFGTFGFVNQQGQPDSARVDEFARNIPAGLRKLRNEVDQAIKNDKEGQFKEKFMNLKRYLTPEMFDKYVTTDIRRVLKAIKYFNLLNKSDYVPKWLAQKQINDNNVMANFQYVHVPYTTISDSAVKVTDAEIEKYMSLRPSQFKQNEEALLKYVSFDAVASAADSAAVKQKMETNRTEFGTTTNVDNFLSRVGSSESFYDGYLSKAAIQRTAKDTILKGAVGQVVGPFVEDNSFVMSKVLGYKTIKDSVKSKHIIITTADREGNPKRDDSTASKAIDSIIAKIKAGMSFDSAAKMYSEDGAAAQGGDIGWTASTVTENSFDPSYKAFLFSDSSLIGTRKKVRSQFGYHYIEVTGVKTADGVKVAYYTLPIKASTTTINTVKSNAQKFAATYNTAQKFNEGVEKEKLQSQEANVEPTAPNIMRIPNTRSVIRDFVLAKEPGAVSTPIFLGEKYYVFAYMANYKKGQKSASNVRRNDKATIAMLLSKKKAEEIIKKIGANPASLEEVVTKAGGGAGIMRADSVTYGNTYIKTTGSTEPKVVGFAANKDNQNKISPAIPGNNGVYVIKPESTYTQSGTVTDVESYRKQMAQQEAQANGQQAIEILKSKLRIVDTRKGSF
jgi:peptidyl-prolyl cis-trans isomerase D